jgi:hypothetical protein
MDGRGKHARGPTEFGAVTIGSADPAEEQDLFDSLIAKAAEEAM